jgi:hypothetical protein
MGLRPLACWDCWFESHREHGYLSHVNVAYCQVKLSASGRSLILRGPADCCVSQCDRESSTMRRPWPTGGLLHHAKKKNL